VDVLLCLIHTRQAYSIEGGGGRAVKEESGRNCIGEKHDGPYESSVHLPKIFW
jgi:hypothetical protein